MGLTIFGASLTSSPTTGYLGLSTTTPSVNSNLNWNFTEPTTSDYIRLPVDVSTWTIDAVATFNQCANPWGLISYIGLWDSPTNGNLLGFLLLTTPLNITVASLAYFNANTLSFTSTSVIGNLFAPTLPFVFQGGTVNKQREDWALQQQRRFISDATMWYGEECIVRLIWRPEDFTAGNCERCLSCNDTPNPQDPNDYQSVLALMADVYKQSGDSFCPICNGTGFTGINQSGGGFKPIIYQTFMIASDTPEVRKRLNTLRFWQENPAVNMYPVPSIKDGDLIIRVEKWDKTRHIPLATGERFLATRVMPNTIRTGPDNSITIGERDFNEPWQILVGQETTLKNLPIAHPFYLVEASSSTIETVNVQLNPNYIPVL